MSGKSIGIFEIGYDRTEVFVDKDSYDGSFTFLPKEGYSQIVIGLANNSWMDILQIVLHEAFEFAFAKSGCRFDKSNDLGNDHSGYMFFFNHPQFSNACGISADFLYNVNSKLYSEWCKVHKKKVKGKQE